MFSLILHGWSSWKSAKAIALLAAAALAAGVGSTTAIYTVVNGVLLRPLPYFQGERFVALFGANTTEPGRYSSTSWPDLQDYKQRAHSFDAFGIYALREFSLTAPGEPQHLSGAEATPELVASLGVSPILGRWFTHDTDSGAVISSSLWKRLGANPNIVGQTLTMDGRLYTVTGVMPASFSLPAYWSTGGGQLYTDVWTPLNPRGDARTNRGYGAYFCYARLRPGGTMEAADADVKRIAAEIAREHPREHPGGYTAIAVNLRESIVKEIKPTLLLLFGAAGLLLLITCANVAGLLLARSVTRARETAIRVALGAARWQLGVQYIAEGLLVALAGAAGGLLVSLALVRFVLSVAADYIPRADEIRVNWMVLLFALASAAAASMLFSLAPLWQAMRTLPNEALSDGVRASAGARSRWLSRSLVVAEIALAFTLLGASALLAAHLGNLLRVPPGFDPNHLLTFAWNSPSAEYRNPEKGGPYQKQLIDAIEKIPGVISAAVSNQLPLAGCCYSTRLYPDGVAIDPKSEETVSFLVVSPRYAQTMRIPLVAGRFFDGRRNGEGDTLWVVIDQAAAKMYWPGQDPVGRTARLGSSNGTRAKVIGVVGDVRNRGLGDATVPEVYLPSAIVPQDSMRFVVRSTLTPEVMVPQIRRAIPEQPVYNVATMQEVIQGSVVSERLQSFLMGFFALAALLMAALGVYGVVSYAVRNRTVEIGTRMALGAVGSDVLRLVIGDGLKMAAYGIGIGGVAVAIAALLLRANLMGVRIDDPRPFLYSTAAVAGITALACFFPAWRATLVSPMVAIRDNPGSIWESLRGRAQSEHDERAPEEGPLLGEFVEASRRAESFREATQVALATLRETMQAKSALLLERDGSGAFHNGANRVPVDGLLSGRLRGFPHPLPLEASDFDTWSRWTAAVHRPEHQAEIETLRASGAALAMGLHAKNEMVGILLLGPPEGRSSYGSGERRVIGHCAGQFALMIANAQLNDRMVEQEKLLRDMQLAAEVQKRLFPDKPPAAATVTLAGTSLPARGVGGDYYDFLDLGEQRIGIALADVAGKGVAAALIMSIVQASLRILATEENVSLSNLAARMNRILHRSTGSSSYATFFYGQIDERKRQLRYVNAGHNPPFLLRYVAPRAIEELPAGGTVIGLFPQMSYQEASVDLQPGDVLVAFTDGVPEAQNPMDEEFGEERLKVLLRESAHLEADGLAARIASEMKSWIADAAQYDDLTFLVVKVTPTVLPSG